MSYIITPFVNIRAKKTGKTEKNKVHIEAKIYI